MSTGTASQGVGRGAGRVLLILLGVVLAVVLILQLIPAERTNPPVVREPQWDSDQTRVLAQRACFDCHSNETTWPWYSYVAPMSWLVSRDVVEGRQVLNFSDWDHAGEAAREPGEITEVVYEGQMPPQQYLRLHNTANLTDAERQQLAEGLRATIGQDRPTGGSSASGEAEENEDGERGEESGG